MAEKKKTDGQKFLEEMTAAADDKSKLLELASRVIQNSPSKRNLKDRKLPENETAVKMRAAVAKLHALQGRDVSTDEKLLMIADKYGAQTFKSAFKIRYPQEYGGQVASNEPPKTATNQVTLSQIKALKERNGVHLGA